MSELSRIFPPCLTSIVISYLPFEDLFLIKSIISATEWKSISMRDLGNPEASSFPQYLQLYCNQITVEDVTNMKAFAPELLAEMVSCLSHRHIVRRCIMFVADNLFGRVEDQKVVRMTKLFHQRQREPIRNFCAQLTDRYDQWSTVNWLYARVELNCRISCDYFSPQIIQTAFSLGVPSHIIFFTMCENVTEYGTSPFTWLKTLAPKVAPVALVTEAQKMLDKLLLTIRNERQKILLLKIKSILADW